jgi:hypothetical protein
MNELVKYTVKIERVLYDVTVLIWEDTHQTISYHPIPDAQTRLAIDEKIARWTPRYRKQQQKEQKDATLHN